MTIPDIIESLNHKEYIVYREPYRLNLIGIRSDIPLNNQFKDHIAYFYYDDNGMVIGKVAPANTDAIIYAEGLPHVLKPGQYQNAYKTDYRHSQKILVQVKPVKIETIKDRERIIGLTEYKKGLFSVDISSAGMGVNNQLFEDKSDFTQMLSMAGKSADLYDGAITYTLLDEAEIFRAAVNAGLFYVGLVLALVIGKEISRRVR